MFETIISFVERMYRETGEYPIEIALPKKVWVSLAQTLQKICVIESGTAISPPTIVLAQGTRIVSR